MAKKERKIKKQEPLLQVYLDRSELIDQKGKWVFKEGKPNASAVKRLEKIREALKSGFLSSLIDEAKNPKIIFKNLSEDQKNVLKALNGSVTSEVGRAIVGLTILQMCVKAICPQQSIRLHKSGRGDFSWVDGIPMRVLDQNYITPVLRKHNLLSLNSFGFMMTRSLAENYPYTKVYKAAIRGAKDEWIALVDEIEIGHLDPREGLLFLIVQLNNRSERFKAISGETVKSIKKCLGKKPSANQIIEFLKMYINESDHSARLFEIALHSLFQALDEYALLEGPLKPLSQMRSANKKHGNVGDVEVTLPGSSLEILEAWDAKYGKEYLRDELEELNEKLRDHSETKVVGFVVDRKPSLKKEIQDRMKEINQIHQVKVFIMEFSEWAQMQIIKAGTKKDQVAREWLLAFTESLCQLRRDKAPIDEPSDVWVQDLKSQSLKWFKVLR